MLSLPIKTNAHTDVSLFWITLTFNIRICQFEILTYVKKLLQTQIIEFSCLFTSFQNNHDIMTFYCYIVKYFTWFISFPVLATIANRMKKIYSIWSNSLNVLRDIDVFKYIKSLKIKTTLCVQLDRAMKQSDAFVKLKHYRTKRFFIMMDSSTQHPHSEHFYSLCYSWYKSRIIQRVHDTIWTFSLISRISDIVHSVLSSI